MPLPEPGSACPVGYDEGDICTFDAAGKRAA